MAFLLLGTGFLVGDSNPRFSVDRFRPIRVRMAPAAREPTSTTTPAVTRAPFSCDASSVAGSESTPAVEFGIADFAHELSGLLERGLRSIQSAADGGTGSVAAAHSLAAGLVALHSMRDLLERAMRRPGGGGCDLGALFTTDRCVGDVLKTVESQCRELCRESHVGLRVECSLDAARVPAGPLEPVLLNPIRNAVEACARASTQAPPPATCSPSVTVAVCCHAGRLVIDVVDNGLGLRGDVGHAAVPMGHGLGLAIVRRIVQSLSGTVSLSNVPFGAGAIFRAEIPLSSLLRRAAA